MNLLLQTLKNLLLKIVDDIDAGNTNADEDELCDAIEYVQKLVRKDVWMTKYQACKFLNGISRATFDNLVAAGELPRGQKVYAGDTSLFWLKNELLEYKQKLPKK
jgi:predicted DNA-binding transcriptional regulator AlpA